MDTHLHRAVGGNTYTIMTDEIKAYIHGAIDSKLRSLEIKKPLLITRQELIDEIGRNNYEFGVINGRLTPIKGKGVNATVRFRYSEVEAYLDMLSLE